MRLVPPHKKLAIAVLVSALSACGNDAFVSVSAEDPAPNNNEPNVTQEAANRAPVISGTPSTTIMAGQYYEFAPVSADPEDDPLTFGILNTPSWASFDRTNGVLSGTPSAADVGTNQDIVIGVMDNGNLADFLPGFSIEIVAAPSAPTTPTVPTTPTTPPTSSPTTPAGPSNNPPVISGSPTSSLTEGTAYSFRPSASDQDGDSLSFIVVNAPPWTSFNASTGELSGTPSSSDVGSYNNILIAANDGQSSSALSPFTITVTANNQDSTAPLISNTQVNSIAENSATITWNTNELASSKVNFGSSSSYGNAETSTAYTSSHSYTLSGLSAGSTYHYQITVTDASGNTTSSSNATFTTAAANTPPSTPTPPPQQAGNWTAPTGIPAPEFGIAEQHTMYANAQYDFGNGPEAYKDAGNGPYTHYVDRQHANATDASNPYGSPSKPRATIPNNLAAGSVVEVRNGPYTNTKNVHSGTYLPILNVEGTAEKPVFIRGVSKANPFEIGTLSGDNEILIRDASYLILENALIKGPSLKIYQPSNHVAIRHSEITGVQSSGILIWTLKLNFKSSDRKEHIVIYDNKIHNNGKYPATAETNKFGIMIDNASENIWVIDNNMFNNGDDSVQVIDRNWVQSIKNIEADRIFIGRNLMYKDGENAIDVKGATNVIISENEMYGYRTLYKSSAGEAIRINDEGRQENIWIMYNRIYDSNDAIDPVNAETQPYVIGNVIYDVKVAVNRDAAIVTNNTIYNCDVGVKRRAGPHYELSNNIISNCGTAYEKCGSCGTDVIYSNVLYSNNNSATCTDCIYSDPGLDSQARPQAGSPAINAAGKLSPAYGIFFNTYGIDIRKDIDIKLRPQGDSDWDIGAYEIN